jgi:uroporphyrinogen-III decarboxylase
MDKSPAELFVERQQRLADAVALRETDRVPFLPFMHFFPKNYIQAGHKDLMFDYDVLAEAHRTAILDLEPDAYTHPFPITALGPLMDILSSRIFQWPGGSLADNRPYQYVEGEYMKPEEYDDFLFDPTDFMLRIFLPRAYAALEPLKNTPYWPSVYYTRFMSGLAVMKHPEISSALKALAQAADEAQKMMERAGRFTAEMADLGYPAQFGGVAYAPFDYIGDLLRGTRGIFIDMFRCPDKLQEAMVKTIKIVVRGAVTACRLTGNPYVFIPLHKGNDRQMSLEQFKTFYWPTLKQTMLELIELGLVPSPFWESECESRLEIIGDMPPGKTIYMFESTNLFKAKEIIGRTVCIRGNVPASLLCVGKPDDVKEYCRRLIQDVGRGGGFILDGATGIPDEAKIENARAMSEAIREYGRRD